MAKINTKQSRVVARTHEGAPARRINALAELKRSVMACLLWEDQFYESGEDIASRIQDLVTSLATTEEGVAAVAEVAAEARTDFKLRHVPLKIVAALAQALHNLKTRTASMSAYVAETLAYVIQRPDELSEFLAIYWKDGRKPLSAQIKKGLARAFTKFSAYQLAKYNRDGAIKLRDVLFLCHAKPQTREQAEIWKKLVEQKLETPDTWEVALSAGTEAKKDVWERLLRENKLGALALLRNLRNMEQAQVSEDLVKTALATADVEKVLPFRFISAARYAPQWEPQLEAAMLRCLSDHPKLAGKTAIVIDNSGSMYQDKVSAKSELTRADAACALAILLREVCEDVVVIGFADTAKVIPARRGFALAEAIQSGPKGGTNTQDALDLAARQGYDRVIVVTDEQSHQAVRNPQGRGYFVNVASYKNGIGYGQWNHIDGWSEAIVDYIITCEKEENAVTPKLSKPKPETTRSRSR